MAEERRITVRASEELHKAVRVKAAKLGRPVSEIVRRLLTAWVEDIIVLPEQEEDQKEE